MITGFASPDDGYIKVDSTYLFNRREGINLYPERRSIGYVPQNYLLFPHLTVYDNVAFGLKVRKVAAKEIKRRTEAALDMCGIRQHQNRQPSDLSGGEQQRVALARAIVTNPRLLLLDEPFSALDVQTRRRIRTEVRDILQQADIPSILVTHDPTDALAFGEQICVMERGRLIQRGNFQSLRQRPRSRFVAEFIGLNAFGGTSQRGENGLLQIKLDNGAPIVAVGETDGRVLVLIDPTDLTLSVDQPANSARNSYLLNVSELHEETGGQWKLVLRGALDLTAYITSEALQQ